MKCYFVRHGKTQWNVEGRFQGGGADSPLLPESYEEIRQLGIALKDVPFDAVYSSDLKRAYETAQLLLAACEQDLEITQTKALREWGLGKLEGAKIATMNAIYPHQMDAFRHNLARFNAGQFEAESIYQTTHRVCELVDSLKDKHYQHVLFVGHGANLTASIRSLLGYEPALLRANGGLDNASLTILETNDFKSFHCLTWNDKNYLNAASQQGLN
ncbi:histidine phosphatase family protein [Streptococcus halichoeri]|uniref:histidine phosphatase family protein n=1 Tax=Streptococcus halichoeri TaxID=254785 RepID=UPI000DB3E749|nr:histidine phosphatase family protein [Streptococcus halichoeri]PZO95343.1 MAG: histidine phosphatase family protein [Streptococcus pyogenes]